MTEPEEVKKTSASSLDKMSANITQPSELEILPTRLSQSNLLHTATLFVKGHVPFIQTLHRKLDDDKASAMNFIQMSLLYPIFTMRMAHDKCLDAAEYIGSQIIVKYFPTTQIQTVILLAIYSFLSSDGLRILIPLIILVMGIIIAVVSTMQIIRNRQMLEDFRLWSSLLALIQPDIDRENAEYKFMKAHTMTYLQFFGSMLVIVAIYPVNSKDWLPSSELFVCAFVLSLTTFYILHEGFDRFTIISIVLVFFGFIPRIMKNLEGLYATFFESLITIGLGMGFVINISLPTLGCLILPGCFLHMAARKSWHGIYSHLLPHVVFCAWGSLASIIFADITPLGLVRAFFVVIGASVFLPIFTLLIIAVPALALGKGLAEAGTAIQNCSTAGMVIFTPLVTLILHYRKSKFTAVMPLFQVCLMFGILSYLYPSFRENSIYASVPPVIDNVEFEMYRTLCHKPAWDQSTIANVQSQCSHLHGLPIVWDGVVSAVKVVEIYNRFEENARIFTNPIEAWIRCTFGTQYSECDSESPELERNQCKVFLDTRMFKCHLKNWNLYKFEITVKVGTAYYTQLELPLDADTTFTEFAFNLTRGDIVKFQGTLLGDVGGLRPRIRLMAIACITCNNEMQPAAVIEARTVFMEALRSFGFICNFLLSPLLEAKLDMMDEE